MKSKRNRIVVKPKIKYRKWKDFTGWELDTRRQENKKQFGRRYQFNTEEEAWVKYSNLVENGFSEEYNKQALATSPTIKDEYYDYVNSQDWKQTVKRDRLGRYNNYLDDFFKDMLIDNLSNETISNYSKYIKKLKDIKTNEIISDDRKYILWKDIASFVNYVNEEIFNEYRIIIKKKDRIKKPKYKEKTICYENDEFEKLLNVIDDPVEKAYFCTLAYMGLRMSEARGIKFKNIDIPRKELYIGSQLRPGKKENESLKTKDSERYMIIPDDLMELIKELKSNRLSHGINDEQINDEYIFVNEKGDPVPAQTIRRHYGNYIKKAGIRYLKIHDLRHYAANIWRKNGWSITAVQDGLGHSRNSTTVYNHYFAVTDDDKKTNAETLNKIVKINSKND